MSKATEQLGHMLKPSAPPIGVVTGKVISISPLSVRISDTITAKYPKLFYTSGLVFMPGDDVIVIASTDNQRFYVVGKVVSA